MVKTIFDLSDNESTFTPRFKSPRKSIFKPTKPASINLDTGAINVAPHMDARVRIRYRARNAVHLLNQAALPPPASPTQPPRHTETRISEMIALGRVAAAVSSEDREWADRRTRRLKRKALRKDREAVRSRTTGLFPARTAEDPPTEDDEDEGYESPDETVTGKTRKRKGKRKRKAGTSTSTSTTGGGAGGAGGGETGGGATAAPDTTVQFDADLSTIDLAAIGETNTHPPWCPIQTSFQPLRRTYKLHPIGDRTDAWYIEQFRRLWAEAESFSFKYYANSHNLKADGNGGTSHKPWSSVNHTPEFLYWVEQVAEADPRTGWDALLRNSEERKWLVMAVVMRVLRIKVFDEELFGADEREVEMLHANEKNNFLSEGFHRTQLRACMTRSILQFSPVTPLFYSQIASLTLQIWLLLEPLTTYLYTLEPDPSKTLPLLSSLYQSLHNLISSAAYLSIIIRLSPTIFHIVDSSPGDVYDADDVHSLEAATYTASKQRVMDAHTNRYAHWMDLHTPAKQEVDRLAAAHQTRVDAGETPTPAQEKELSKARAKWHEIAAIRPAPPAQSHRAMTKIAVWPTITRFKPGSEEEEMQERAEGKKKELWEKDGMRLLQISKAAVVCYYGNADRAAGPKRKRLGRWIKEQRGERIPGPWMKGASFTVKALLNLGILAGVAHDLCNYNVVLGAIGGAVPFLAGGG